MAIQLFQSTAGRIPMGPFLDDTDGKTPETGLTIANTDIKVWKDGATALVNKNSGGAVHMAGGVYYTTLDATDTSTIGSLVIYVHVAGALPIMVECDVKPLTHYIEFNFWRHCVALPQNKCYRKAYRCLKNNVTVAGWTRGNRK